MEIGGKIKRLRVRLGLTQEELAARTELTKGFISQLERDITSPSIATLMDILEALGTNVSEFFSERETDAVAVYTAEDMFLKEDEEAGVTIRWLVTNAQKNAMEPILVTLSPGASTEQQDPHEGEEFGYVLSGSVTLVVGSRSTKIKAGSSFCLHPRESHYLYNHTQRPARFLWISTPPSF
jgi:transcriptional regulator with XRE-family HTH domain